MKVTNPDRRHAADATRGNRSTVVAGSKGMIWRDASTESVGQVYDMTVVGADFLDNEDGTGILTIGGGTPGAGTPPWINPVDYGAAGDGTTDDTAAINAAINDINAGVGCVLYFPCGTYKVTSGLNALFVPALILGDGAGSATGAVSTIQFTHASANLFTLSSDNIIVRGLRLYNSNGSESAGSGAILTTTGFGNHNRYEDLWVEGFYDGMRLLYGFEWAMVNCHITNPVRYGVHISNLDLADAGDWSMVNVWIGTRSRNATSAIRQESAGGGKLVNVKINENTVADQGTYGGVKRYVTGYDLAITTGGTTSILLLSNISIENVSGDAYSFATSGSGTFDKILMAACQAFLPNNSGYAVHASGTGLSVISIDDSCAFRTSGTARAAISMTNVSNAHIGAVRLEGFNTVLTSSGTTNVVIGATQYDTHLWRPVVDGAGAIIVDGSGQALMAYGAA